MLKKNINIEEFLGNKVNLSAILMKTPKNYPFRGRFCWTAQVVRCNTVFRMKFGSSFCRVTGVSSLNLARRPKGWRASFVSGSI
jgi:hypothetical protein